eukprot:COSAG01_NODE_34834_length_541_cov_1.033937_1_plen_91_part_00
MVGRGTTDDLSRKSLGQQRQLLRQASTIQSTTRPPRDACRVTCQVQRGEGALMSRAQYELWVRAHNVISFAAVVSGVGERWGRGSACWFR